MREEFQDVAFREPAQAEQHLNRILDGGWPGFADPAKARRELLQLCNGAPQRPHSVHARQLFSAAAPTLLKALSSGNDPDGTLVRLGQVLENVGAPGAVYDLLNRQPRLCDYLVTLVSNSQYLAQILVRDPALFDTFGYAGALDRAASRDDLEVQLANLSRAHDAEAAPYRLRDGEMLRVGMRELFNNIDVLEVGLELSLLAEVCLACVLAKAQDTVAARYGASGGEFAVLGLGKFGGRELGYGSDLDLVFVYDADAVITSGTAPAEYFTAVASHTIRYLKEPTRHGVLYDVDARLRPDGKKGMLTVSSRRLREYYAKEAQPWELLALVKARAVAGNSDFAERMEEQARTLAFAAPFDHAALANVEEIRRKIAEQSAPLDLKKDEGGIISIEFAVRLLQLRHAEAYPELKRGDVVGAIGILQEAGLVATGDAETLAGAYKLFRRIENRLRMMTGRSGSGIPDAPEGQADLARRLSLDEDLAGLVREQKKEVHTIYRRVVQDVADGR